MRKRCYSNGARVFNLSKQNFIPRTILDQIASKLGFSDGLTLARRYAGQEFEIDTVTLTILNAQPVSPSKAPSYLGKTEIDDDEIDDDEIEAPPVRKPKDGDHVSLHTGHKIVTVDAISRGEKAFKVCRTCGVEVTDGPRTVTGAKAKLFLNGKEIASFGSFNWLGQERIDYRPAIEAIETREAHFVASFEVDKASGDDLDKLGQLYGVERFRVDQLEETDDNLRKRLLASFRRLP